MADKHLKGCLSLVSREVQIQTTMRYNYILTRLAKTEGMTVSNAAKDLKQLKLSIWDCQECKNDKTT